MPLPYAFSEREASQIGWNFVMQKFQPLTPYGQRRKRQLQPYHGPQREELRRELGNVASLQQQWKAHHDLHEKLARLLPQFPDVLPITSLVESRRPLDEVHLFKLKKFGLLWSRFLQIASPFQASLAGVEFVSLDGLTSLLDPSGEKLPTFQFHPAYSAQLAEIRGEKRSLETQILASLDRGRPQIPADLKHKRDALLMAERAEIMAVRAQLTEEVAKFLPPLKNCTDALGYFDFINAKVQLAEDLGAVTPEITQGSQINLKDCYNPLVATILEQEGRSFVPVSVTLGGGVSLLTGANMGGKTVCLQTLLLNVLLAHHGFFVFAKQAEIPLFEFVGGILNDRQDISLGLSSFGAEIVAIKRFLSKYAGKPALLVFDEFARGTNPFEGKALLQALITHLTAEPWTCFLSTHYSGISTPQGRYYQVIGLRDVDRTALSRDLQGLSHSHPKAGVAEDASKFIHAIQDKMDYHIEEVSATTPVPREAIQIAEILGLPEPLLRDARRYLPGSMVSDPNPTHSDTTPSSESP